MRRSFCVALLMLEAHGVPTADHDPRATAPVPAPRGDLWNARAHWLSRGTIAWDVGGLPAGTKFALHYCVEGPLALRPEGVTGGVDIPLALDPGGLDERLRERFPHLAPLPALKIPTSRLAEVPAALRGALAVSARDASGALLDATSLQIPGVLDELHAFDGPLGATSSAGRPTLRLWAPTARSVRLLLFDSSEGDAVELREMTRDAKTGVWSVTGDPGWIGRYYLYEVDVYVPSMGRVERNRVTDPYSVSLSRNSRRSQIVDLGDTALEPPGWHALSKPPLEAPEDIVLYELHVRDFSAGDPSVPEPLRGTFKAFTLESSRGLDHLTALGRAGLTHVHLLPCFDIATIDEDRSRWLSPEGDLGLLPPESDRQQAAVMAVAERDGYNWGYDPFHYNVPEGSYSTDPDGPARIREFREMVKALAERGLRVVMDVVYNHTAASGQGEHSVLDGIVPGYYHRLDADGRVATSTCCSNTATEHAMMEKLMVDSVLLWARAYKVDGFRFDLMGHHMKGNMLRVRQALDTLTPEADGVDGRSIYVYGEGWDFGEVARNARGVNATQINMAGTGIGTFNDRLRDAARGGSAFGPPDEPGFLTGLEDVPKLLLLADRIRVGLAGSLAGYVFTDRDGRRVRGDHVDYDGQAAGYARDPQEAVNYVEAHDNETLFDAIQMKAPRSLPMAERVRAQNLGMSLVALGQGVPFFHAGMDLLRSKSLDRNSYNSGDWFNRLDFTYETNNWGVGLPPASQNHGNWPLMAPLLADPGLRPGPADIRRAAAHLREVLRIRRSSRLFRLRTAEEIQAHLRFLDGGPSQVPGLIVMSLEDPDERVDPRHPIIVVLFNARGGAVELAAPHLAGLPLTLHPEQAASDDWVVRAAVFDQRTGALKVPGRTASVFWVERPTSPRGAPR